MSGNKIYNGAELISSDTDTPLFESIILNDENDNLAGVIGTNGQSIEIIGTTDAVTPNIPIRATGSAFISQCTKTGIQFTGAKIGEFVSITDIINIDGEEIAILGHTPLDVVSFEESATPSTSDVNLSNADTTLNNIVLSNSYAADFSQSRSNGRIENTTSSDIVVRIFITKDNEAETEFDDLSIPRKSGNTNGSIEFALEDTLNSIVSAGADLQVRARTLTAVTAGDIIVKGTVKDTTLSIAQYTDINGTITLTESEFSHSINSTGITYFEGLFINANTALYDLGKIEGWFVTQGDSPTRVFKSFDRADGLTTPFLGTNAVTLIAVDESGTVITQTSDWTELQRRTLLIAGQITHIGGAPITKAAARPNIATGMVSRFETLCEAIGKINVSGNVFSAVAGTLSMQKTLGMTFAHSANYQNDPNRPDTVDQVALNPCSIQHVLSDSVTSITNFIDPDNWESPLGTLDPVQNNRWTIQRIYLFQDNNIAVTYGQVEYSTELGAQAGIATEIPVILESVTTFGTLRGYILCAKGETLSSNFTFIEA